ncbi:Kinesin light chain 3 [Hondaea fermentalgiana]|uniref:Kinesin light chain 3 n=1 Tax=Hondaea fermentalgiana TaxID=2315210 RepID=A0A2R5GQ07_9STRA|nr:Kinesin light chain 3 [Hondaea fermentalgiana]|eukprot:GBG32940.1 Kinesin light chain 3 [Hondaea fermentalgiana]
MIESYAILLTPRPGQKSQDRPANEKVWQQTRNRPKASLPVGPEANKSSNWSALSKNGVVAMMLRHLLLLEVLLCASALTRGATCTCEPRTCDGSSTDAFCDGRIGEDEHRNTDVFEPSLSSLTSLTYLSAASNQLTSLPKNITGLSELTELKIDDTDLTKLPQAVSNMTSLIWVPEQCTTQSPTQSPTQYPTQQTQPPTQQKKSPPRLSTAEPTAINDDESSTTTLALTVSPLAGAFDYCCRHPFGIPTQPGAQEHHLEVTVTNAEHTRTRAEDESGAMGERGSLRVSVRRMAQTASGKVAKALGKRREETKPLYGDDDLSDEDVCFRGLSLAALQGIHKGLMDGKLARGVHLYELTTDGFATDRETRDATRIPKGKSVHLVEQLDYDIRQNDDGLIGNAEATFVQGYLTITRSNACFKPREEWTMEDVAEYFVVPKTILRNCLFLDTLGLSRIGTPFQGTHVCISRQAKFDELMAALSAHFQGCDPQREFIWLDIFCAKQPRLVGAQQRINPSIARRHEELITGRLHQAIARFSNHLVFMETWDTCTPLSRMWCVWEMYGAIKSSNNLQPLFAPGQDERFVEILCSAKGLSSIHKTLANLDLAAAQSQSAKGRDMIVAAVHALDGGFASMNTALARVIRVWLADFAKDIIQRLRDVQGDSLGVANVMHNAAWMLRDQSMFEEALPIFRSVLDICTKRLHAKHVNTVVALHSVASTLRDTGDVTGAIAMYKQALDIRRETLGPDHKQTAATMKIMARVMHSDGDLDAAVDLYKEVLVIRRKTLRANHTDTLAVMHALASVLLEKGDCEAALALSNEVLSARRQRPGHADPLTLAVMQISADALQELARYDEALALFHEMLRVCNDHHGPLHTSTLSAMHNVATALQSKGDFDGALASFHEILDLEREAHGSNSPLTASTMNSIADVLHTKGELAAALSAFEASLAITRGQLANDHPSTVEAMQGMARVLRDQGEYDKALALMESIFSVCVAQLGEDHPHTLATMHNKARILLEKGDFVAAMTSFEQVLKRRRSTLGPSHPATLATMNNMASLLLRKRDFAAALASYQEVLNVTREQAGPAHPSTLATMACVAKALQAKGDHDKALSMLESVLEKQRTQLGSTHPSTIATMHNKALVLQAQSHFDEALGLLQKVLDIHRDLHGEHHPSTTTTMHNMALVLQDKGDFDAALHLLRTVLEIEVGQRGSVDPIVISTRARMALMLRNKGDYDASLEAFDEVLRVRREHLGEKHPATLTALHEMASVLRSKGDYEASSEAFSRVLKDRREQLGAFHPATVASMHNQASVLRAQGKYAAALEIFQEVLRINRDCLGDAHDYVAVDLYRMAFVLVDLEHFKEALEASKESLAIFAQADSLSSARHLRLAAAHLAHGRSLLGLGRQEEAIAALELSVSERERHLGAEHPTVADALYHLAGATQDIAIARRALEIRTRCLEKAHPLTIMSQTQVDGL